MGPSMSCFIKCVSFALANHRSGESAEDDMRRALDRYNEENTAPFSLMEEYEVLAKYPKWMLDTIGDKEQADRRAGIAQETPVAERVRRMAQASPTVANTDKPEGVKKARRTMREIRDTEKELAVEEKRLGEYIEQFSRQAEIQIESLKEQSLLREQLERSSDNNILLTDTSGMSPEKLAVYSLLLKSSMDSIVARSRRDEELNTAAIAAAAIAAADAAAAVVDADAAAAVVAAAVVTAAVAAAAIAAAAVAAAAETANGEIAAETGSADVHVDPQAT